MDGIGWTLYAGCGLNRARFVVRSGTDVALLDRSGNSIVAVDTWSGEGGGDDIWAIVIRIALHVIKVGNVVLLVDYAELVIEMRAAAASGKERGPGNGNAVRGWDALDRAAVDCGKSEMRIVRGSTVVIKRGGAGS